MTTEDSATTPTESDPCPSRPLRLQAAFSDLHARLDELEALVTAHNAELALTLDDDCAGAVLDAKQRDRYQAPGATRSQTRDAPESTAPPDNEATGKRANSNLAPLFIAADYSATDSSVSPRRTLERFRLEVDLPGDGEMQDVSIRVGDDQSAETFLSTWEGFSWGQRSVAEVVLRCFFHACYGSPEFPAFDEYPETFDQVLLFILARGNSELPTSHGLVVSKKSGEWMVNERAARTGVNSPPWHSALPCAPHPLHVMWLASGSLDGRDIRERQERNRAQASQATPREA